MICKLRRGATDEPVDLDRDRGVGTAGGAGAAGDGIAQLALARGEEGQAAGGAGAHAHCAGCRTRAAATRWRGTSRVPDEWGRVPGGRRHSPARGAARACGWYRKCRAGAGRVAGAQTVAASRTQDNPGGGRCSTRCCAGTIRAAGRSRSAATGCRNACATANAPGATGDTGERPGPRGEGGRERGGLSRRILLPAPHA